MATVQTPPEFRIIVPVGPVTRGHATMKNKKDIAFDPETIELLRAALE